MSIWRSPPNFRTTPTASVKSAPTKQHYYSVKNDDVDVAIQFDPATTGLSSGHPVYALAHSKISNPVINVLHDKAQQLRDSNLPEPYGIFLPL